ncbi:disulfide oxidoreductase [Lederbergia lenta]|uniref:Probable disulfide formation protein n=1 Tax=Lederbergia lenta TaxID=1467 RepID=A0A2X4WDN9_LEDLE|nr:disulfide oxidoreductase [Lederbergia lenta]MCM3110558.1 disulfide oxidoreductase [Lederbergia lenta]MEC2323876.1 disulfide oxidoreductase [Lederbergia lenta]SQI61163.1 disulfide formation protein [Lederbergia lenta]
MVKQKDARENLIFFAWAVSVIATLGSLYFSEIKEYVPCELCWYQRILMYPLVIILGIGAARKDYKIALYSAVFSGIGMFVSLYHYLIQKVPAFAQQAPACGIVPCTGAYINWAGFITIPFLALIAFILIFITSMMIFKHTKED